MARSFGLAAYRAFAGRGGAAPFSPIDHRPKGEMVWCHAPEPGNLLAIQDLALRLCRSRPGLSVLITIPKQATPSDLPQSGNSKILIDFAPEDHPTSTKLFLDHCQILNRLNSFVVYNLN